MAAGRGRPSVYTPELAAEICARLAQGRSLRSVCNDIDMPHTATVYRWLGDPARKEFCDQYARARQQMADAMTEEIISIADEGSGDVNRDRLRVDARKWLLSKVMPRKYGDRLAVGGDLEGISMKAEISLPEAGRAIAFALAAAKQTQ